MALDLDCAGLGWGGLDYDMLWPPLAKLCMNLVMLSLILEMLSGGHKLHFGFRALTATVAAARRVLDKEPARLIPGLWNWNLGWSVSIYIMIKRNRCQYISPWHWKYSIIYASVVLNIRSPHWCSSAEAIFYQLHEGFRAQYWNNYQYS